MAHKRAPGQPKKIYINTPHEKNVYNSYKKNNVLVSMSQRKINNLYFVTLNPPQAILIDGAQLLRFCDFLNQKVFLEKHIF